MSDDEVTTFKTSCLLNNSVRKKGVFFHLLTQTNLLHIIHGVYKSLGHSLTINFKTKTNQMFIKLTAEILTPFTLDKLDKIYRKE